jgi:hypothetical protein
MDWLSIAAGVVVGLAAGSTWLQTNLLIKAKRQYIEAQTLVMKRNNDI